MKQTLETWCKHGPSKTLSNLQQQKHDWEKDQMKREMHTHHFKAKEEHA